MHNSKSHPAAVAENTSSRRSSSAGEVQEICNAIRSFWRVGGDRKRKRFELLPFRSKASHVVCAVITANQFSSAVAPDDATPSTPIEVGSDSIRDDASSSIIFLPTPPPERRAITSPKGLRRPGSIPPPRKPVAATQAQDPRQSPFRVAKSPSSPRRFPPRPSFPLRPNFLDPQNSTPRILSTKRLPNSRSRDTSNRDRSFSKPSPPSAKATNNEPLSLVSELSAEGLTALPQRRKKSQRKQKRPQQSGTKATNSFILKSNLLAEQPQSKILNSQTTQPHCHFPSLDGILNTPDPPNLNKTLPPTPMGSSRAPTPPADIPLPRSSSPDAQAQTQTQTPPQPPQQVESAPSPTPAKNHDPTSPVSPITPTNPTTFPPRTSSRRGPPNLRPSPPFHTLTNQHPHDAQQEDPPSPAIPHPPASDIEASFPQSQTHQNVQGHPFPSLNSLAEPRLSPPPADRDRDRPSTSSPRRRLPSSAHSASSLPWSPFHPCYPHRNPHVPLDSPLYHATRVIRIPRDWMSTSDLSPTFTNTYPEILNPWIREVDFRRLITRINDICAEAFTPRGWRALMDLFLGAATGWLWEDIGATRAHKGQNELEKWIEAWNGERDREFLGHEEEGLVAAMPVWRTGYLCLDIIIPDPKVVVVDHNNEDARSGASNRSGNRTRAGTGETGRLMNGVAAAGAGEGQGAATSSPVKDKVQRAAEVVRQERERKGTDATTAESTVP